MPATTTRRLNLVQHIPKGDTPAFAVAEIRRGENYWRIKISDAMSNMFPVLYFSENSPEFRLRVAAKSKAPRPTPLAVAAAAVRHMSEGRGLISLQEYADGIVTFAAVFVANGSHLFCLWSTDPDRCPVVDVAGIPRRAKEAIEAARVARAAKAAGAA
jgi:hypothetical protein